MPGSLQEAVTLRGGLVVGYTHHCITVVCIESLHIGFSLVGQCVRST
nr:MAG TPA: hypothetical protein [Caudoviricetes sp.]